MVTLIVATSNDPASINPARKFLEMPGWRPHSLLERIDSFSNKQVRLLIHSKGIVEEDNLDQRWEEAANEVVDEVIFLSKHTAASEKPALTIHPIGVPHLCEEDALPHGGKAQWAAPPNPRMGEWLRLLKKLADAHHLLPEFQITLEATHHGPITNKPTMFIEIGSTTKHWDREDAAEVISLLLWKGLGLGDGPALGNWSRENSGRKVLLGIGGGHYVPRHMDVVMKDGVWVGHLLSTYSLPMEEPPQRTELTGPKDIAGTWRQAIKVALDATKAAFPDGEILAHFDHKNFKGWQKKAIESYLQELKVPIGKPNDFYPSA